MENFKHLVQSKKKKNLLQIGRTEVYNQGETKKRENGKNQRFLDVQSVNVS